MLRNTEQDLSVSAESASLEAHAWQLKVQT